MSIKDGKNKSQARKYKQITPVDIAKFQVAKVITGNGTAAVRLLEPNHQSPSDKANDLAQKSKKVDIAQYLNEGFERASKKAMQRVSGLIESRNERIGLSASTFVLEQQRGKAVQRSINENFNHNIQNVLD